MDGTRRTHRAQVDLAVNGGLGVRVESSGAPGRGAGGICRPPGRGGCGQQADGAPAGNLRTAWGPSAAGCAVSALRRNTNDVLMCLGKNKKQGSIASPI